MNKLQFNVWHKFFPFKNKINKNGIVDCPENLHKFNELPTE